MPETIPNKECPDCGGEGSHEYMSDGSPAAYYYTGECETCRGTGIDPLYIEPIAGEVLIPEEVGE